jgi:hypothetical protein
MTRNFLKKSLLGFLCPIILRVAHFYMDPSLHLLVIQNAPCPHYFSFYISNDLSKHVKSAHLHADLVSQASQVVLSLQMSSLLCYTLVLSLLFLKVNFGFSLGSCMDFLKFVSPTLDYFIGSKPSRMRSSKLSIYPLTKLFKI